MLLEYERQIFTDLLEYDGLLVMARGLGLYRIAEALMKAFCHPASLLLVLNASSYDMDYFIERLRNDGVEQLPQVISADISRDERVSVYLNGGVLFVSNRILVMDLLTGKIPAHLITGILVYNAHRVKEAGLEAFIMRLFRQRNQEGFIKGFSDHPVTFTDGYCQVEKVMRSLFLKKLFLYPRFQVSVKDAFEKSQPEVIELGVPTSPAMKGCQMAVLELINLCIKELKLCNPSLDLENISFENLISTAFDATVRVQLDPIWHQLTNKTKQLVSDLKTLRELLRSLTHYDCVTFYSMVRSLKASEKQFKDNAGWLYTDSADRLYKYAKKRVYGTVEDQAKNLSKSVTEQALFIERNPKWDVLTDVMKEINATEETTTTGDTRPSVARTLIVVESEQTCNQIKDYLVHGPDKVLQRLLAKYEEPQPKEQETATEKAGAKKGVGKPPKPKRQKTAADNKQVTLTQLARGETPHVAGPDADAVLPDDGAIHILDDPADCGSLPTSHAATLIALRSSGDQNMLIRTLDALQPKYVVMFDINIAYIRQLEIYKACRPGIQFRVYIMMFTGSSEEQRFLTAIRKEKNAFEELIRQKGAMVIPENRDGKTLGDAELQRNAIAANQTVSTRKGGNQLADSQESKVIVDMREFRSDLPFLVHKLGIGLEPATLEVGDYILTEDICVERKSVSDLIGSLSNGRLYNQCTSMSRYYKRSVLLIEFDPTRPFTLQKNFSLQQEISINDIQSRLTLLTLHFPKLRIVWCQSSHSTADLFRDLKRDCAQPDVNKALTVTSNDVLNRDVKYNTACHDLLMKLPSISTKNVALAAENVTSIKQLASMDCEKLGEVLSNKRFAESIITFFNTEFAPETSDKTEIAHSKGGGKFRKGK